AAVCARLLIGLLLNVATAGIEELQVAALVRSSAVPFLNVPVATNCCWSPITTVALLGVIAIVARPATDPLPRRSMVWGLLPALSSTVSTPVLTPIPVGLNVILTGQVPPGEIGTPPVPMLPCPQGLL